MRISDWSSDVCSSDLPEYEWVRAIHHARHPRTRQGASGADDALPSLCRRLPVRQMRQASSRHRYSSFRPCCSPVPVVLCGSYAEQGSGGRHRPAKIGRAHVGTPVTNAHLVVRLLLETKKETKHYYIHIK